MKIVDLTPEHKALYCICLEDWSEEMKEAGDHKEAFPTLYLFEDKPIRTGPPPSFEKIRKLIGKRVKRL